MASVIGIVKAPNGTYQKDGETKTRWLNCGLLLEREDGSWALKLDALPVNPPKKNPDDQGLWFNVYPPEDTNG